jgi:hypothetical protein
LAYIKTPSHPGDGTCVNGWGAQDNEVVTISVFHNGLYYDVPYDFTFPTNNDLGIDPPDNDFCVSVTVTNDDISELFLPASLLSFSGRSTGSKTVQLNWVTTQEEEVSHYDVEYSPDGTEWETIGQVAAAGNSTERLAYDFVDNGELSTTNFYRLNMVDLDGSSEYSGIVIVTINDTGDRAVSLFPNPATADGGQLSIQLRGQWNNDQPITAQLFDVQGRSLSTYTNLRPGTSAVALPAGTPAGLYLLRTSQGDVSINQKLIVR